MKKIIHISLPLLLAFLQVKAQDSLTKTQLGIELAYAKPSQFKKDGFFPSLTVSTRKQVFFAGPCVVYYDYYHPRPLHGVQGGYRLFPNGRNKRFSLFFECSFNFVKGKLVDKIRPYYSDFSWGPRTVTRTISLISLDNFFGFGCRWNLSRKIFLSSSVGFGFRVYKEDYTYLYSNGDTWSGTGKPALLGPSLSNTLFKIGIGYDIFSIKRKN